MHPCGSHKALRLFQTAKQKKKKKKDYQNKQDKIQLRLQVLFTKTCKDYQRSTGTEESTLICERNVIQVHLTIALTEQTDY